MINNSTYLDSTYLLESSNLFLKWDLTGEVFKIMNYFSSDKKILCYSSHYPEQLSLLKESAFLSKKVNFVSTTAEEYARVTIMTKNDTSLINKAKLFAIKCVYDTNHYYGKDTDLVLYSYHLAKVYNATVRFVHLVSDSSREITLASAWTHDSVEDHRVTKNDIINALDEYVADISFALTNEKGATRKDRANDKYYSDMKKVYNADFLKLMDRVANIEEDGDMKHKYKKEMPNFFEKLKSITSDINIEELDNIIENAIRDNKFDTAITLIQNKKSMMERDGVYPNFDDMKDLQYADVWKHMHSILN